MSFTFSFILTCFLFVIHQHGSFTFISKVHSFRHVGQGCLMLKYNGTLGQVN